MFDELLQLPLFQGITADQLILFAGRYPFHFETLPADYVLINRGEVSNELIFIIDGKVRKRLLIPDTKVVLIEEIDSPFTIPPTSFYGKVSESFSYWETITETRVLRIRKEDYQKMVLSNSIMLIGLLNLLANQAQMCTRYAINCSLKDLKSRFAFWILSLTHVDADVITLKCTRNSLSSVLGVSNLTLKKLLEEMSIEGLIGYSNREISIRDRKKMEQVIF